jgi:hypothetical protein
MSPPPRCNANPSNHKTNSTTTIAHKRPAMFSLPPLLDTRRSYVAGAILAVGGAGRRQACVIAPLNNAARNSPQLYKEAYATGQHEYA